MRFWLGLFFVEAVLVAAGGFAGARLGSGVEVPCRQAVELEVDCFAGSSVAHPCSFNPAHCCVRAR